LYFPSPIFLIAALWIRRSLRNSLKRREFELDRDVAEQFDTVKVLQVLEKILSLDQKRIPTYPRFPFLAGWVAYWNPSIRERTGELSKPRPVDLPRPSRIPRIGLRGRVITVVVGFARNLFSEVHAIPGLLMGSYDDLIINLANGLARQLDLSGVSFSSVMWQQGMVQRNRGRIATIQPTSFIPIPSDGALFRNQTIYLAQNMEGKLSVDEWKPLIASALINQKK